MGRMVSCVKCGAWGEAQPEASPRDWLCAKCSGAESPVAEAHAAPVAPQAEEPGRPVIGSGSGEIGTAAFSASSSALEDQIREMRAAVDSIRIGTSDLAEAAKRLAGSRYPGLPSVRPGHIAAAAAGAAGGLAAGVAAAAREEAARAAEKAKEFARLQAVQAADTLKQAVEQKGVRAVPEIGRVARAEATRIGAEARQAVRQQVSDAATRAGQAARRVVVRQAPRQGAGRAAQGKQRAIKRAIPQTQAVCGFCHDRTVLGDRIVSCPDCGTRYHADCYKTIGTCISDRCQNRQASPLAREAAYQLKKEAPRARQAQPGETTQRCHGCGARVGSKALVCPKCGKWLQGRKLPRAMQVDREQRQFHPGCAVAVVIAIIYFFIAMVSR